MRPVAQLFFPGLVQALVGEHQRVSAIGTSPELGRGRLCGCATIADTDGTGHLLVSALCVQGEAVLPSRLDMDGYYSDQGSGFIGGYRSFGDGANASQEVASSLR
jgi:hypothetical protein